MGRPTKQGLDYFPLDTDFFEDEKIKFAAARFGLHAESIIIRLLCRIYRNSGFMKWNDDTELLFASGIGKMIPRSKVHAIVDELLKRDFFSQTMYDRHGILTSRGIQRRYINVCSLLHRKSSLPSTFLVSSEETTEGEAVNTDSSAQMKRKEKKGNEMKGNETRETAESAEETAGGDLKNISLNSPASNGVIKNKIYECDPEETAAHIIRKHG